MKLLKTARVQKIGTASLGPKVMEKLGVEPGDLISIYEDEAGRLILSKSP